MVIWKKERGNRVSVLSFLFSYFSLLINFGFYVIPRPIIFEIKLIENG